MADVRIKYNHLKSRLWVQQEQDLPNLTSLCIFPPHPTAEKLNKN